MSVCVCETLRQAQLPCAQDMHGSSKEYAGNACWVASGILDLFVVLGVWVEILMQSIEYDAQRLDGRRWAAGRSRL